MATTSNLGTIHVFNSLANYNTNSGSVGANDLALVPLVGEIVAQSLGANGYVKFANGLIMQWGVLTWTAIRSAINKQVNLNIAFTNTNYALSVQAVLSSGTWNFGSSVSTKTTSSFIGNIYGLSSSDKSTGMSWFAIGN